MKSNTIIGAIAMFGVILVVVGGGSLVLDSSYNDAPLYDNQVEDEEHVAEPEAWHYLDPWTVDRAEGIEEEFILRTADGTEWDDTHYTYEPDRLRFQVDTCATVDDPCIEEYESLYVDYTYKAPSDPVSSSNETIASILSILPWVGLLFIPLTILFLAGGLVFSGNGGGGRNV